MSNSTDNSSNQLISANSQESNDNKYKLKCISITKLIKEMIFNNNALDMKLKDNHKEIVKLKIQREFLIAKLINYEKFELNDIKFALDNEKLIDNLQTPKSKTKKRVKSTSDLKKAKTKINKTEDDFKNEEITNVNSVLKNNIKIKLKDVMKDGFNEDLKQTNIINLDNLSDDNLSNMKISKLNPVVSTETATIINQASTNSITTIASNTLPNAISSSSSTNINSPSTSNSKLTNLTFNNLSKQTNLHQTNILTGNKIILSKNVITGSKIVSAIDPNNTNLISSPNSNLISNSTTINHSSSSLSNSSNHFLNASNNKDNVRIIINKQQPSNQFVIKPVNLNQKNIIKSKIIKNLNSLDEGDENSKHKSILNNSFYLNQKQDVQNYVNINDLKELDNLSDSKTNLINLNDLDKNGKTISFGLIV